MNKNCIITGATDGIGKQTALDLARLGYRIGLVGRDLQKGELVLNEIENATNNQSLKYFRADLSNIKSIERLSNEIKEEYDSVDILINNAGAYFSEYIESEEGLEMTFALNHLNYFRLTHLLMDIIKIDLPGRVINVASSAHFSASLNINDIQMSKGYKGWTAYCNSKLMNILFTYEIHKRYKETGITFNVYGESDGEERLIPFDFIPRIIFMTQYCKFSMSPKWYINRTFTNTIIFYLSCSI